MKSFQEINSEFIEKISSGMPQDKVDAWVMVRSDKEFLRWAMQQCKDKWGKDSVNAPHVCEYMLANYTDVDEVVYQRLINTIYLSKDIARISLDGDRYSFLLMSLYNPDMILTDMQKDFAYEEAMNDYDTVRFANKDVYDGVVCDHGSGAFDIRYWILRNNNWSIEEKRTLVYDFFADQELYEETLANWESNIFDEHSLDVTNHDKYSLDFTQAMMYDYSYEYFYDMYGYDKDITDEVWQEIQFCNLMHLLRPTRSDGGRQRGRTSIANVNNED